MELKVWVDGIQRVVCGANYSTTCQDVVLALAHAMSRTGRFTLVEKWRDSERPLTPGECPLQSLHKWGEYASEVRFYLVQAETDKAKRHRPLEKLRTPVNERETFSQNPVPSKQPPPMLAAGGGAEFLKRASTFSGAHNLSYAVMPSSSFFTSTASSSHNNHNQDPGALLPLSKTCKTQQKTLGPLANGDVSGMSSLAAKGGPAAHGARGPIPASHSSSSGVYRGDVRELHPANMPGAPSQYSNQNRGYPPVYQQYPAEYTPVPSKQPRAGLQQHFSGPDPGQAQQLHPVSTLKQSQSSSSQYYKTSTLKQPHSVTPQSPQKQPSLSQLPAHPVPAPRHHITSSSPPVVEYANTFPPPQDRHQQPPSKRERSLYQPSQKIPVLGNADFHNPHPEMYSSSTHQMHRGDKQHHSSQQSPRDDQTHRGDKQHHSSQQSPRDDQTHRRDKQDHSSQQSPRDDQTHRGDKQHHSSQQSPRDQRSVHQNPANYPDHLGQIPQNNADNYYYDTSSQGRSDVSNNPKPPASTSSDNSWQTATLDRHIAKSQRSRCAPNRSLSTGAAEDGDADVRNSAEQPHVSYSMPVSAVNPQKQSRDKISFVDSALMRRQQVSGESSVNQGKTMSSFASAVAHVRQQGQYGGNNLLRPPKSEAHVRQHSSDSSKTDSSFKPGLGQNTSSNVSSSGLLGHQVMTNNNRTNHYHPLIQSPSSKPVMSFHHLSSPRHNSAFKEVPPRSGHQESSSSPQNISVAYNLDNQTFNPSGIHPSISEPNPQESFHSRQASLEIEEYDLDQNFPDMLPKELICGGEAVTSVGSGDRRSNLPPLEYHLESGDVAPVHSEAKYMELLRIVRMQQERIEMQEAKIQDTDMEIFSLEEQDSTTRAKLEIVTLDISELEKQEAEVNMEVEDLEKVEWINVVDGEQKREADIKLQMKRLKEQIEEMDSQLRQQKVEEERTKNELKAKEDRVSQEKRQIEQLEQKTASEVKQIHDQLTSLDQLIEDHEKKLKYLEELIIKTDQELKEQDKKATGIEEKLKDEKAKKPQLVPKELPPSNLREFQVHSISKGPPLTSVPDQKSTVTSPVTAYNAPDSGEAILKILEGHLSPRLSPATPSGDGSSINGITSAQHTYMSATASKNPNGVWV